MLERNVPPEANQIEKSVKLQTVISPGLVVKGDLHGESNVEIKGIVEGNVRLDGLLVVGKGARITGDVWATTVIVDGQIIGNIDAKEKVQLGRSSQVKGTVRTSAISIQDGALFQGRVEDLPRRRPLPAPAPRPAPELELEEASVGS